MSARRTRTLVLLACFLEIAAAAAQPAPPGPAVEQCRRGESVTSFGRAFQPAVTIDATDWSQPVPVEAAGFTPVGVRLLLAVSPDARDRDWSLVVRDPAYRVLASFGPADFADGEGRLTRKRWTGRLPAAKVQVELLHSGTSDVEVRVEEGVASPPAGASDVRLFSSQTPGQPNWRPLYEGGSLIQRRTGDVTGMLVTGQTAAPGAPSAPAWCCTGVMVARDLFLTNWHCGAAPPTDHTSYWNERVAGRSLIDLGWDDGTVSRQYNAVKIEASDRRLDYALLRVEPVVGPGGAAGSPSRATIAARAAQPGEEVFIVHHAECEKKRLSRCQVAAASYRAWTDAPTEPSGAGAAQPDLTHSCDTEPGASGAPVFAIRGGKAVLVGLHHLGFDRDESCAIVPPRLNKAVRIDEIVKHLGAARPDLVRELDVE
jgi:hypothetical protein